MKPQQIYRSTAWKYFSRYVLLYYSDGLITQCFTCGKPMYINSSDCHCGHLIKVTESYATAFDFTNTGPQCLRDNRYFGGKQDVMYQKLLNLHGKEAIEMLYIRKHNICKLDKYLLDVLAMEWKQKFEELVKTKGNPWKR